MFTLLLCNVVCNNYDQCGKKSARIGLITSKPLLRIPCPIATDEQVTDIKASIESINNYCEIARYNPVVR